MKDFRLIAIRPLNGTSHKFKKNLQNQVIYKFYQDFKFVDKAGDEILKSNNNLHINKISVLFPEKNLSSIYSSDKLNINVSAIVGENGSGKSNLIDFYNLILYYLASNHFNTMDSTEVQILNDLRFLIHFVKEYYGEIKKYQSIKDENIIDLSINTNELDESGLLNTSDILISILEHRNILPFSITNTDRELKFSEILWRYSIEGSRNYDIITDNILPQIDFIYKELNRAIIKKIKTLIYSYLTEKKFNTKLKNQLNFQIFYQIEDKNYLIEKINQNISFPKEKLFYTILLNYSLHSMNSNNLGAWIYKLFHKNDGYQTPNVINPYRENGNINVNSELALSTDRLIYNIVDQCRNTERAIILKKYKFKKFIFKLKNNNNYYALNELNIDYHDKEKFLDFLSQTPSPHKFDIGHHNILDYCLGYMIKKFRKISSTYMKHFYKPDDFSKMDFPTQVEQLEKWQAKKAKEYLLTSDSHVARKFNQTYNFLVNYKYWNTKLSFLNDWNVHNELYLTEKELRQWISIVEKENGLKEKGTNEVLMQLFPAIFNIDIEFEKNNSVMKLSDFSSGEQQYLFNINTITYHINNLKTIKPIPGTHIKRYSYINIILDEIELYYHPEYQKRLVKDLIDEINQLDSLGDLKNFNILFLTHSPFILSDIPNQNILRLKEGEPSYKEFGQTFGANIHDLLANDFFLEGFMGEFAKKYIKELTKKIEEIPSNKLVEDTYVEFLEKINLIGEPVIKNSIKSFLDKKFEEVLVLTKRREELNRELSVINKRLK